eukprot:1287796-Rhodomonas_salina.5
MASTFFLYCSMRFTIASSVSSERCTSRACTWIPSPPLLSDPPQTRLRPGSARTRACRRG